MLQICCALLLHDTAGLCGTQKCRKQHLLLIYSDCYVQETDDNEPQLEDTADPAPAVTQSADSLPGERDIPVNIHLLTRALRVNA